MADGLADRLLGFGGQPAESVASVLFAYEHAPLSDAFAVQLVHRLRDQDPTITPALTWLDQRLSTLDMTTETVVRDVHRRQGASNVTVRNIITSLRLISDVDWQQLFERLSLVDAVFAAGSRFEDMDFPTRTLYRSAVEQLARGSRRTELEIAGAAVFSANRERALAPPDEQARRGDPGYHLLAGGRRALRSDPPLSPADAKSAGPAQPIAWRWRLCGGDCPGCRDPACRAAARRCRGGNPSGPLLLCSASLAPFPPSTPQLLWSTAASTLALPRTLPGLELRDGVPSHLRTLVAVPTLLTTRKPSKSRSSDWRSITSRASKAICISR